MEKILIVVPDDRLGGAEQYLKNIAFYHLEANNKVFVVFLKKQISGQWEDLKELGQITFYYTNSETELSGLKTSFLNLVKLKCDKFDYVYTSHLHTTSFIGFLIRLGLIKKNYFVGRESTTIFHRFNGRKLHFFKMLYRLGYPKVDLLISQTELMRKQLIYGLPWIENRIKVKVIPNPINLKVINKIQLSSSRIHPRDFIVSAGRLIPEKGYDILIDSFKEITEEYPKLDLLILGEGDKRSELEQQIKKLGLENKVQLKGHVDNVYDYFKQAKLCVVSSRVEGFPNVLLQMMSQNNRVVSTKCAGGIEELKGVISVSADDRSDLVKGLKEAIETNLNNSNSIFTEQLKMRSVEHFQFTVENLIKEGD